MSKIQHSVEVGVPVRTAYNQWTQFATFPDFMEGVQTVEQLTDTRTVWVAEIAGVRREFEAEIVEQCPDERVAWCTVTSPHHTGVVSFDPVHESATRVTLTMEYDPMGPVERVGDALGIVGRRIGRDLNRFRAFIESRGVETGAWRGEIPPVTVPRPREPR
ncbi:SRPBCC family protein [Rhizohabitans arisaemae]|uniref:SRPBCC family protein n=1 Tax=Rhizohabitans arisaemae TaxID=2720610 RepID=UPI0024B20ADE|nr:SRPBCC family protein [Rhizohabitans arisaemae]